MPNGIRVANEFPHFADADWLRQAYEERGVAAIATELGCNRMTVYQALERANIARDWRRPTAKKQEVPPPTPQVFCSPELSETRTVPETMRDTKVYFLRREIDGAIKIGITENMVARISNLRNGGGPMQLLALIPGGRPTESSLHKRFDSARLHGKWFSPVPELMEVIGCLRSLGLPTL